tara:strand:+ start:190 stop:615 length:426 start_codon:yes stop_codon:yes gene_type:complete
MNNVNKNNSNDIKLIRHYIKDLSFENPQDVNQNKSMQNNNHTISSNMNVIYAPYNNNFFSLIVKIILDCSSKEEKIKLSHLELDYFGFFKNLTENLDQKLLTEHGLKLIFPFAKTIIEEITSKGGSIPISVEDIDFTLLEN